MAGVPFIFGNATTSIPLTNLDANFNTGLTIGNTTVGLGNTVTTLGNVTLNNANFGAVANAVIYTNSGGNVTSNASVFTVDSNNNVGIGTTTPTVVGSSRKELTLKSTVADTYSILNLIGIRDVGGNQNGDVNFINSFGSQTITSRISGINGASSNTEGNLVFQTKTSAGALNQQMLITGAGLVQVFAGSTNTTFTGPGDFAIKNGSSNPYMSWHGNTGTRYGYMQANSGSLAIQCEVGYLSLGATSGEAMRITSSGTVLIGTTSNVNSGQLCIAGGIAMNSDSGTLVRGADTSGTTFGALSLGQSFGAGGSKDVTLILANNAGQRIYVQNRTAGVYLADGGTSWTSNSDERIKTNLVPIDNASQKISTLRAVIGEYIDDPLERRRPFLIAQDVDKVFPEAVDKTKDDVWGLQYADLIPLLVAAIKELNEKVTSLEAQLGAK